MGRWFQRHALASVGLVAAALIVMTVSVALTDSWPSVFRANGAPGAFYRTVPYLAMLVPALVGGLFILSVLAAGFRTFWKASDLGFRGLLDWTAWVGAGRDALWLTQMRGGGDECYYPSRFHPSSARRHLHSLVVWGFAATFVSTILAAFWQEILHRDPPYPVLSPPVLFGIAGGGALILGTSGLLALKWRLRSPAANRPMLSMDLVFLGNLDAVAVSGMLTLLLRGTALLGPILGLHIACLFALYVTAPYGKFVHSVYRFAAILEDRVSRTRQATEDLSGADAQ